MMKSASLDGKLNNMDKIFSKDRKRSEIFKIIKLNKLSGKKTNGYNQQWTLGERNNKEKPKDKVG